MSIPALKLDREPRPSARPTAVLATTPPAAPAAAASIAVLAFPKPSRSRLSRLQPTAAALAERVVPPLLTILVLLLLWEALCSSPGAALPSPSRIVKGSWELIVNPFYDRGGLDKGLGWHILASLRRVALGYSFAAVIGILLGTLVGQSMWAQRGLDPLFQVLRTIPPLAWLPLSLAAFRDGQPSAIFVIFITAVWPVIINTSVGIRNIPPDYLNVARVIRLNRLEVFAKITLPAAAPYIFTGLRIGIGLSWLAIVAAEMLVGGVGIGFFIWDAWNSSLIGDIVVALAYVGLVGFALDRLIAFAGTLATRGTAKG